MKIIKNDKYVLVPVPDKETFCSKLGELERKKFHLLYNWDENRLRYDFERNGNTDSYYFRYYWEYYSVYFFNPRIYIEAAKAQSLGVTPFDEKLWNNILVSFSEEQRAKIDIHQRYTVIYISDLDGVIRYILDPDNFDGTILTTMTDGEHSDYGGEILYELQLRDNNSNLKAVTRTECNRLLEEYHKSLCKPFEEITEEKYWYWLECVPPRRFNRNSFFVGECYTGTLYQFCFQLGDKYYTALRSIRLSDAELNKEINDFAKTLKSQ